MTTGVVTNDERAHAGAFIVNDVGGTTRLPEGTYRVRLDRQWDDYEIGGRMAGTLIDLSGQEAALTAGTTGYGDPGAPYEPTQVYFGSDDFAPDAVAV
jgi:hypothetical protein